MTNKTENTPVAAAGVELAGEVLSRREALTRGASATSAGIAALAFVSVPVALAAFSRSLLAQAPSTVLGALQFAYLLENLESEFYKAVLGQSSTAAQNTAFAPLRTQLQNDAALFGSIQQIAKHEAAHVAFLRAQITALGGTAVTYTGAEFDFTGGNGSPIPGPFAAARNDVPTFLALAQVLEDTGVRAYKGQLENLSTDKAILTAAMRIHSVEGRHAARIRRLRGVTGLKPWITSTATATTAGIGITTTGGVTAPTAAIAATTTGFSRSAGAFATEGFTLNQEVTAVGFTNPANNGTFIITELPGKTGSVTLAATAFGYTRATGSFITNGFVKGQQVTASGFSNAANNGRSTILEVTDTMLIVQKATPTVAETARSGRQITADEIIRVSRPGGAAGVAEAAATGRYLLATRGVAPAATTAFTRAYTGENNTTHRGIDMAGLGSNTGGVGGVTEAFDEPMTYDDVIVVIRDFVIGSTP